MAKKKIVFEKISPNEVKFTFNNQKFLLIEKSRGVLGIGKSVNLFSLDGLQTNRIKEIGWTKSDNHRGELGNDSVLQGIQTWEKIQEAAVGYLEKLLA
jgi:hypothetical protein